VKKPGEESSEDSGEDDNLDWLDEETRKKKEIEIEKKKEKLKEKEIKKKEKEKMKLIKKQQTEKERQLKNISSDNRTVEERISEINQKRSKVSDNSKLIYQVNRILKESLTDEQKFRVLVLQLNLILDQPSNRKESLDQKSWRTSISILEDIIMIMSRRKDFELVESGKKKKFLL
jgi:hypothetical protein